MISRFADPRVQQPDPDLARMIDLVRACVTAKDLDFMFPDLSHIDGQTWRVPIDRQRALRFEWVEDFGAINIRLE